jgi:hypothetical protein
VTPDDALQQVPGWRRGAARRLRWRTRNDGNGWAWLAAGLLLTPVPGLVLLLPPDIDGFLFWPLWPPLVCWLALQVGRLGRSVPAGILALVASVVLVVAGPVLVQLGELRLAGRTATAVVVEHRHQEGIFWSVWPVVRGLPGVLAVPWATETYRLRTVDGEPIGPAMVTAAPVVLTHDPPADPWAACSARPPGPLDPCRFPDEPGPVGGRVTVRADPLGVMPPVPAGDLATELPDVTRFWLWSAGAYALAVAWASVRRRVVGRGGMPRAARDLLSRRQRAVRRHRRGVERSRRRNRARS